MIKRFSYLLRPRLGYFDTLGIQEMKIISVTPHYISEVGGITLLLVCSKEKVIQTYNYYKFKAYYRIGQIVAFQPMKSSQD